MALIVQLTELHKERNVVHDPVECGYTAFDQDGSTYLQLDTYGSPGRQIPGKVSQSIQLDLESARSLKALIERTFPRL